MPLEKYKDLQGAKSNRQEKSYENVHVSGEGGGVKHAQISAVGMSLLKGPWKSDRRGILREYRSEAKGPSLKKNQH